MFRTLSRAFDTLSLGLLRLCTRARTRIHMSRRKLSYHTLHRRRFGYAFAAVPQSMRLD